MKKHIITIALTLALVPSSHIIPAVAADLVATPTASTVLVNGQNISFDAYNIEGNNYFKLRDLAYTLSNTEKQFEVGWDDVNNAISLTGGQAYTNAGGEMAGKGAGNKTAASTDSRIYLNGEVVAFVAYNIDGNNYFKLRDIGQIFNIGVDWDAANNTIVIDTGKSYTAEATPNSARMYSDWPTVPDYGVLTGAQLNRRVVLEKGTTLYYYNIQSAPAGSISTYCDILTGNGFSFSTSYDYNGGITRMFKKDGITVSIGDEPEYILVLMSNLL